MARSPSPLQVGAAMRTINPPLGAPLIGYPSDRPNTGIGLDLCVRAALFGPAGSGTPASAVVVLDTLGVSPDLVAEIRALAAAAAPGLPREAILVAATHTHSAPTLMPFRKGNMDAQPDRAYRTHVLAQIEPLIREAWSNRADVTARVGLTEAKWGMNRRVVDKAGKATNVWRDPQGRHPGYCNSNLRFAVFERLSDGKPHVILNTYGCHPVVLGGGNTQVSADYPGYLVRKLEAQTGAACLHLTNAAAQINPRDPLHDDPERARPMGEALAAEIAAALPFARPLEGNDFGHVRVPLNLKLGPEARANYSARAKDSSDGQTLASEIQALKIGDLAFVTAPGELFAELGVALENQSPFRHTFVVTYANDNLGYLFTDSAYREGGYEPKGAISEDIEAPLLAAGRSALEAAYSPAAQGA